MYTKLLVILFTIKLYALNDWFMLLLHISKHLNPFHASGLCLYPEAATRGVL